MSDQDTSTFEDRAELMRAQSDPRYAESARFRDDVAAKLQRSMAAGTIQTMGQFVRHQDTIHTTNVTLAEEPEGTYGSHNPVAGANPNWAEAAKVGSGFFEDPQAIARATSVPQYEVDASYRDAVHAKIGRSVREGFLTADWQAAPESQRFTR